jgi:hypothetical protein
MKLMSLDHVSKIVSWLPALFVIAADGYVLRNIRGASDASWWWWICTLALAAGTVIPRLWSRLTCTFSLAALCVLGSFSIGVFYVPALLAAVIASLLQMDLDWKTVGPDIRRSEFRRVRCPLKKSAH